MLSGARGSARKAFALLIVLSFVFSLPVSAASINPVCVLNLQPETFGIAENSLSDPRWAYSSIPASFSYDFYESQNYYEWYWEQVTALTDPVEHVTSANKQIEAIITVGNGEENLRVDLNNFGLDFYFIANDRIYYYFGLNGYVEVLSDSGEVVYTSETGSYDMFPTLDNLSFNCSEWFSVTYYSLEDYTYSIQDRISTLNLYARSVMSLSVENVPISLDSISIQIENLNNTVTDIGNDVGSIKTTVENIQEGVVEINGTVTDMKEQLEEPDSPIWSAAGEKIADTIKGVFVPSEEEMQAEKQELENLLDDKLGDAKVLLDQGETLVTDIRDIIGNMSSDASNSVHFPGISFPMNGETYVIVPEQDVKLNNRAFLIFQNALGMGITVLCWWSILHICEDLLYCLISGVSYWGFIRSRHNQ